MRRPWLLTLPVLLASCMVAWWLLSGDRAARQGNPGADSSAPAASDRPSLQEGDSTQPSAATSQEPGATADDPRFDSSTRAPATPPEEDTTPRDLLQPKSPAINVTGPGPMSQEGQTRIDAMLERLRQADRNTEEYEMLAGSEPRDPDWSERMEATLRHAILRHGGALTGLEVSAPRCTQTLCKLTAASHVVDIDQPDSDWQRLVYAIAGEPWWRQEFFDVFTSVTSDDQGALYVTYFLRK